ncbi:ROK family transcriptional regulator [Oceanobacillus alkalisoli]|uniref:ROK family transcriptional regulator n=1 Tax=Oceanobacillus alkalisoli TaxID=2925113 RepID=UPI001F11BC86|nr:ROK family transcriptional regulator [Oceanobacillus alkalisoli]MCF3943943.1 ROK family transcriptional regulator [Oceanobacillus alkalisoli]
MVIGDGAYIKKLNRSLILQKIIEHEFISRAEIAKITGLNKATISVQVADLLDAKLVQETQQEHNTVGRRPIMLSINESAGYVLGIDLDFKEIKFQISDLQGNIVETNTIAINTEVYEEILYILIEEIRDYKEKYSTCHYGLVQAIIGVHGTVNNDEWIQFIPRFHWSNKDLKSDIEREVDVKVSIENTANLSIFAERVYKYPESDNMLGIVLISGIGAGIINDGKLVKGHDGYAGEIGHMIISPFGQECRCGNSGCWELYAAEPVVFSQLMERLDRPNLSYNDIKQLLAVSDPTTCEVMKTFISYVSIGLNNMINSYNPETLIINSELLKVYPNAIEEIEENLQSSVSVYRQIVLSDLGKDASVLGACALAIQNFFQVEEVVFSREEVLD